MRNHQKLRIEQQWHLLKIPLSLRNMFLLTLRMFDFLTIL